MLCTNHHCLSFPVLGQFLDILIAINDTIAEFFINVNTSEDELRKRVCKALERAEVAK